MKVLTISLSLVLVVMVVITSSVPTTFHSDLVNKLLAGYQPHLLPQKADNHTVSVAAGLSLIHIQSLSQEGVLSATAWLRLVWNDHRLEWEEEEFGGVSVFRIDPNKIWLPDIEVYNMADPAMMKLSSQFKSGTHALVYPNGEVLFIPPVSLKVMCHDFNHTTWPQGEQNCSIKLASWAYDGYSIDLTLYNDKDDIDLVDMSPSSPWVVTGQVGHGTRTESFYTCCPEPYPALEYKFKVSPQYPVQNPGTVEVLVYQVLVVTSTCLAVLVGVLCLLARISLSLSKQTNTNTNNTRSSVSHSSK